MALTAERVRLILNEPRFVLPVIRCALSLLGEQEVIILLMESLGENGMVFTNDGTRYRTLGGIFLKKLKKLPQAKEIFRKSH